MSFQPWAFDHSLHHLSTLQAISLTHAKPQGILLAPLCNLPTPAALFANWNFCRPLTLWRVNRSSDSLAASVFRRFLPPGPPFRYPTTYHIVPVLPTCWPSAVPIVLIKYRSLYCHYLGNFESYIAAQSPPTTSRRFLAATALASHPLHDRIAQLVHLILLAQ